MNKYWVKRDHLINERASMDVSTQDAYVCVMIEEELSASIMRLVKNEPINKKLMEEAREKIEELQRERDTKKGGGEMHRALVKAMTTAIQRNAEVIITALEQEKKMFICEECFGTNFEQCDASYSDGKPSVSAGKMTYWCCGYCRAKKELAELKSVMASTHADHVHETFVKEAIRALAFYADPRTYHACAFTFDPPTGGFETDFSMTAEYEYEKPGKTAREVLAVYTHEVAKYDLYSDTAVERTLDEQDQSDINALGKFDTGGSNS